MKENYRAWDINFSQFDSQKNLFDQLQFLIQFAVLAPSGHNTQPWKFLIRENEILLCWIQDKERQLIKSDPALRQLFISLGCALENLLIAADYYNFETQVEYLPEIKDTQNVAAKIIFKKKPNPEIHENHLIFSIPKRHTNRNKYEATAPDKNFKDKIKSLGKDEMRVDIVEDSDKRQALADIAVEALIETMDDDNFRSELSQYLKPNFTNSKLGMPAHCFGIPTPVSLFAHRLIRRVNMNRLSRKQDEDLLKKFTPLFCVVSSKTDSNIDRMKAGQIYERIALEAQRNNLTTAMLAAPIQKEKFNEEMKKLLDINSRPQALFRIGYCKEESKPTPRLTTEEILNNPQKLWRK